MAAARNVYLALCLVAITNGPLEFCVKINHKHIKNYV